MYIVVPKRLQSFPNSRIYFVTIRDAKQSAKWARLSTVRTWVRRYSSCYVIVQSPKGGVHHHVLMGVEPHKKLVPKKGIHFDIKLIEERKSEYVYDEAIVKEERRCKYVAECITADRCDRLIPSPAREILYDITTELKARWLRSATKAKVSERQARKIWRLNSIIDYMVQNIEENPLPELFEHYYVSE